MQFNVGGRKPDLSVSQCRPAQDDGEAPCLRCRIWTGKWRRWPRQTLAKLDTMTDADFEARKFHFTDE